MINFDKYLIVFGLKINLSKKILLGNDKKPETDRSVYAWNDAATHTIKLGITNPQGCWAKAGLHSGDVILKINDSTLTSANKFFMWLDKLKPGDTATMEIKRKDKVSRVKIHLTTVNVTSVDIENLPKRSAKQERLYSEWMMGK